ncbi:MAG: molybdenum cofactor biosynthesis F family protein [Oscillospiraceae bacterium]|nr:molybdenum cofactor biosynthesis F family protein [Oscillospiraceae bacterium]
MFFHKYNTLSSETVSSLLAAGKKALNKMEQCGRFAERKTLKLRLSGKHAPTQLDYTFKDGGTLTVTENGKSCEAPYSSTCLGSVWIFTHLIPGTQRGWHVFFDSATELVTVFETWFGITVPVGGDLFGLKEPTGTREIAREVQREIYHGYNDVGQTAPEKLHTRTNRLEGKGLHWKDDAGTEILTFHPSVTTSTFVELGREWGDITVAAPSDYFIITDHQLIYSRGECEYSGTLVIELIDLFEKEAAGIRLGIDENDALEYVLRKSELTITGQAAIFEDFADYGTNLPTEPPDPPKGWRMTYRPSDMHPPITKADVDKAVQKNPIKPFNAESIMSGANNMPVSDYLVGKKLTLKFDGAHIPAPFASTGHTAWEYEFVDVETLKWRAPGGSWQEDRYQAFETNKDLILFAHLCTGDPDYRCLNHAVDFQNGLVTCVDSQIGNWHSEWEVGNRTLFGVLEYPGVTPPLVRRHHFTDDMVGKSLTWAYSDTMKSIHVYSSPESYSWTIYMDNNAGGSSWSSPSFFVKLRDDAYLFCWVEDLCNGSQGLMVFNPSIMHDAGYFFGADENGVRLSVMGAYSRTAGSFDILKYFGR